MDLLLQRGKDAMAAGDFPAAIEHLTALTDHAPDFAEGFNARATAYFQAGQLGPSIEDIARTLTLNPRHFGALSGLGMIFEDLGRPEKAQRFTRRRWLYIRTFPAYWTRCNGLRPKPAGGTFKA
jgi:tetratricopeptide (TPR) repeat protein